VHNIAAVDLSISMKVLNYLRTYSTVLQGVIAMLKLSSLRSLVCHRLEMIKVDNPKLAHLLCKLIPAQCPFERNLKLFGRTVLYIPPLCKLNPFYEQVVSLRFKCLCYLADECGEDITVYC
jgi:hypothetical protein